MTKGKEEMEQKIKFDIQMFATRGDKNLTMADYVTRFEGADSSVSDVLNIMQQSNAMLEDMTFKEANMSTGNRTLQVTEIPEPSHRRINEGIKITKANRRPVVDTLTMLEARSSIDVKLVDGVPHGAELRKEEEDLHVEGFQNKVQTLFLYGDSQQNPDEFDGILTRYATFGGDKGTYGHQVINAHGTTANKQTSAILVGWEEKRITGLYPKGSKMGVAIEDRGVQRIVDADGRVFDAYETVIDWAVGLAVKDPNYISVIRNIDVSKLMTMKTADKKELIFKMLDALNKIPKGGNPRLVWYVSPTMYDFITRCVNDIEIVNIQMPEFKDGKYNPLAIGGVPVKKVEAISEQEPVLA